jgi:hypothetical protein
MKRVKPKTKQELSSDIASDVEAYLSRGGVIEEYELGATSDFNPLKKRKVVAGFKRESLFFKGSL